MSTLQELSERINQNARDKGFWEEDRNFGEMIALMHSELSEALEEHRAGRPAIWYDGEKPEGAAVELADCIIRALDTLYSMDLEGHTIDEVVESKMLYNASRPYKHGKSY